jgi:DNA-binding XRE family transcriptional regulator
MTPTQLKQWRKSLSYSQERAAKELGCSRRALQNWEGGYSLIPKYISLACDYLLTRRICAPIFNHQDGKQEFNP